MNRPISVYRFPCGALTLWPQLCMGIHPGARFPGRSADTLSATLYGHFTQAIYRNRPTELKKGTMVKALPRTSWALRARSAVAD